MVQAYFQINEVRIQNIVLNTKINGKHFKTPLRSRKQQQFKKSVMLNRRKTWAKTGKI